MGWINKMSTEMIYRINEPIDFNNDKRILIDTESNLNYLEMVRKILSFMNNIKRY